MKVVVRHIETIVARRSGSTEKRHSSFYRCPPSFVPIARYAGTDHVFPTVLPTTPSGNNMIYSDFLGFPATILTDIPVTVENLQLGQFSLLPRSPNEVNQANY